MAYKTILVHTDLGNGALGRIRLAARLARSADAHLIGSALTGISRFIPAETLAAGGSALAQRCVALRDEAVESMDLFTRTVQEEGVLSAEARLIDDEVDGGMAVQARYCDLVVVGQADDSAVTPVLPKDLPEYLFLTSGRPVLVVPCTGCAAELDGPALVAWDGSVEATRAVDGALPLLRAANSVTVIGFADEASATGSCEDPCALLAAWLARHGIAARAGRRACEGNVGEALLSTASDTGAGLLVMGGYGHSRFRELLTKGVTTTILHSMTVPVLLAH